MLGLDAVGGAIKTERGYTWNGASTRTRRQILKHALFLPAAAWQRRGFAQNTPSVQTRRFSVPLVDAAGAIVSRYNASVRCMSEDLGAGVSLDVALIPGGSFTMGSVSNPNHPEESPAHTVHVPPFGIGANPVTIGQWRQVSTFPKVSTDLHVASRGPLPLDVENTLPIDFVSWAEAVEFCARLNDFTGRPYRLPSEAEWEYACRAGTTTRYHFGDGISLSVANYNDGITRPISLTPVGSKQAPNRFGLNDMHGNVLEWSPDWWHDSYFGAPPDGTSWNYSGPSSSRVTRGGCFLSGADLARSAARTRWDTRENASGLGLRVVVDLPGGTIDPVLDSSGVRNLASHLSGPVAPGQIVSIRGRFGISQTATITLDDQGLASTSLLGIRVLFNDFPAPLLLVSDTEIRAVVPYEVSGLSTVWAAVESQGQTSLPVSVPVAEASPGIFTLDGSGVGQAAALNQDGSPNSPANPAPRGTVITLFATGEGQTSPPGVDGKISSPPLPAPVLNVQLTIGGVPAQVAYAGAAPNEIAGVLQVTARVPLDGPGGKQDVILRVGRANSQPGVFVFVAPRRRRIPR